MRSMLLALAVFVFLPAPGAAQRLREVPQRFAYVQPLGLVAGLGTAGLEFATGRRTTVELGVLGVYSAVDDVQLYGGGAGLGVRRYFAAEPAGFYGALRVDAVRLEARDDFVRDRSPYLGLGFQFGYRWVTRSGLLIEPLAGYEYLVGPRPLIERTRRLQDDLGVLLGVAIGWSW